MLLLLLAFHEVVRCRYIHANHPVGILCHGLVSILAAAGYEVIVFFIDGDKGVTKGDQTREAILNSAHMIISTPLDIGDCAR